MSDAAPGRWRALALISLAELAAMALWFSASASLPALAAEWGLGAAGASALTLAVQFGFVAGTLAAALLNLPDIVDTRRLFAAAALAGAGFNAAFALAAGGLAVGLPLRFLTGVCLAGVYPPGMKLIATWFRSRRGLAIGFLVGALTVGKASPYLVNALGGPSWRMNILAVSSVAALGGLIVAAFVGQGPHAAPTARFDLGQAARIFRNRSVRLANLGYFGHMWEL
jgi:MFS family permease